MLVNNEAINRHTHKQTNKQTVTQRKKKKKQRGTLEEHSNGFQIAH